ncbi:DNA cytosine methyltransferase [Embleya sp. NPDC059259]|uniref:DNA cytosine methyltransferase n=1 Tax=unclassified Embleya TaxID=2699296 RepID=UPI0036C30F64
MTLTMTDLFCGAGGSSTGALQVPGVSVRMAANHWTLAVETHNTNHPTTDHDCADISQVDPRRYPATDILWASPECTNHSIAKGNRRKPAQVSLFDDEAPLPDEAATRSRATMWDVVRFAEHHRYRAIVVENVVDVRDWELFGAWRTALQALGYCVHQVFMNSMFAAALGPAAPQSRDRWYAVAHHKPSPCPDLDRWTRPSARCNSCDRDVRAVQAWKRHDRPGGRYRAQYVWRCPTARCHVEVHPEVRPAADAIDWSLPAQRLADRARPLADKTMRRIRDGFAAYARPLLVPAGGTWNDSAYPVSEPARTRTTRETEGLAVPPYMVELRGGGSNHRAVSAPLATVCANGNHHGVVTAPDLLMTYYGNGTAHPTTQPVPTVTTRDRAALIEGGAVTAVEDCRFRMLSPGEYAAAMAFPHTYVLLGTKRERVRMAGNAVTPPSARDLVAAVAHALTGEEKAA